VNIGSGSPDSGIGEDAVRQHRQDLSRLTTEFASSQDRYPLIRHCHGGRSIDRPINGGHEQHARHARDEDDSEEDETKGDQTGEYHHQKYVSSSRIGTDDSDAVPVNVRTSSQELPALFEPL